MKTFFVALTALVSLTATWALPGLFHAGHGVVSSVSVATGTADDLTRDATETTTLSSPMVLTTGTPNYLSSATANTGTASFVFTIPSTNTYFVNAEVYATGTGNSFFADFDTTPSANIAKAWGTTYFDVFYQQYISFDGGSTVKTWNLTAGTHTFYLEGREPYVRLSGITVAVLPPPPDPPTIGTGTATGPFSALVSYTAGAANGGVISQFIATSTPGSVTGFAFTSSSGTIPIYGLASGTAYTFSVKARSFGGLSTASGTASVTTPALADEMIPASRRFDWQANTNVGVPGGIVTTRTAGATIIADVTGITDATSAIQTALNAAAANTYITLPAGTYKTTNAIVIPANVTLRGAAAWTTIIRPAAGVNYGIVAGTDTTNATDNTYAGQSATGTLITAGGTQGSTVLTVASTSGFAANDIGIITDANDYGLPVMDTGAKLQRRGQMSRITAVGTASTLTISPALVWNMWTNPRIVEMSYTEGPAVEDLVVDLVNSPAPNGQCGVQFWQCYRSWFKNVKVINTSYYGLWMQRCFESEIRHCRVGDRVGGGTNGAAILSQYNTACLFEDNILEKCLPHLEMNFQNAANVFAFNYCYNANYLNTVASSIDTNHGAHNQKNLYEGNVAAGIHCDGYFGSSSEDTVFRNWLHGTAPSATTIRWPVRLNRFTRNYNIVGNILGSSGLTWIYENDTSNYSDDGTKTIIYVTGSPSIGGGYGSTQPTSQMRQNDLWINWPPTTRMDTFSFYEADLDVAPTTVRLKNLIYTTGTASSIPGSEASSSPYPDSMFRTSEPSWFGSLAWPAFSATGTATPAANQIPAGYRYENADVDP